MKVTTVLSPIFCLIHHQLVRKRHISESDDKPWYWILLSTWALSVIMAKLNSASTCSRYSIVVKEEMSGVMQFEEVLWPNLTLSHKMMI